MYSSAILGGEKEEEQLSEKRKIGRWIAVAVLAVVVVSSIAFIYFSQQGQQTTYTINQKGSDTMLILAQKWAEEYMKKHPEAQIAVSGGGSGTGIAALINKQVDIADASREITDKEIEQAKANGVNPTEWKVALDGISVIVHPDNPVSELSLDQLKAIYNGSFTNWKQVGGNDAVIVVYGRQTNSGTYVYWKEHVLKNQDYRNDMQALNGNADIVEAIAKDKNGIGYVGVAYASQRSKEVNILKVKKDSSSLGILPTSETVTDGTYPISRYLYVYTNGIPKGSVRDYIKWILGPEGQKTVEQVEYVPLPNEVINEQWAKLID